MTPTNDLASTRTPPTRWDCVWLLVCAAISSASCVVAMQRVGATYDEPGYLQVGLEYWRTGDFRPLKRMGTMPLPLQVCTLPLYIFEKATGATLDATYLPWARIGNLVFWWLLLFYAWKSAHHLAGNWSARLAIALVACEPNLLAHASLATTDLAVTACLVALLYHYQAGRCGGWWRRIGIPTIWFATAVLAKASGIVFGPIVLFVADFTSNCQAASWRETLRLSLASCRRLAAIASGGMLIVVLYCGSSEGPARQNLLRMVEKLPEGKLKNAALPAAQRIPLYVNAVDTIAFQVRHNLRGHDGVFLLGEWRPGKTLWYYFPVALSIKASAALLFLLAATALLRTKSLRNWAIAAAAALLLFSLTCKVQIGVRYMLPILAFAIVGLSAGLVQTAEIGRWRKALIAAVICLAVAWQAVDSARFWPNGLQYSNSLWGNSKQGYLLLSDSNFDWGQGLPELAKWQRQNEIENLDVVYFGADPLLKSLPMRPIAFPMMTVDRERNVLRESAGRHLAVSVTTLYGHPHCQTEAAAFLRSQKPAAQVGTFLIFDFTSGRTIP